MMQVRVNGEMRELSLIDPDSGVDCVVDFIGNNGGLDSFVYNGDEHECSKDTFDWWKKVIDDQQKLVDRIFDLKEEIGSVFVNDALESIPDCDLEDHAAVVNAALDEALLANAAEGGDNWMLEALGRCDEDGKSREEWYEMTWPEFSQALTNDILPDFKTMEELDAFYDAAWNRLQREGIIDAIDLQREGIIAAIEDYNEGRPDHMHLHFGECKEDFVDPDAGEWKPYGAWNHRGDLVFVCGTIEECRTMLGRIVADEALQEQGWGEGSEAYKEYQKGEY